MSGHYAAPLPAVDWVEAGGRDGTVTLTASKDVRADDPYLPAHFPDHPVYPGVFVLETVRQAVIAALGERAGALPDLVEVRSLRLLRAVRPGERLCVAAALTHGGGGGPILVDARCELADGTEVARLRLGFGYEP
ncbi:3-hydroxyacyl-[acyl-carrier-protein] dehydratase FabZ [Solihabitans fulvus]|uniref:3-hydroxyacyl-[acyl-carrier-protein] dehydratase FabZ n=1 Tax=Solihabitans fulvus TaxID=1892852 RepID=A0A5B2XQU3_9PSEU|nr:3-hydroxyacyl-[acyl-carrier-protein] dehydratase FabZ [Solihabitans fulvus]KAA2265793.1 3-hydroxyacyl-[acyl-carrier-protein] dehydratase FabZ [Solihabitans fulvus]